MVSLDRKSLLFDIQYNLILYAIVVCLYLLYVLVAIPALPIRPL